jgi:hypothetical protein
VSDVAIEETVERAKPLLFDAKGQRRPEAYYIALYTLQTVLRLATVDEALSSKQSLFDWGVRLTCMTLA